MGKNEFLKSLENLLKNLPEFEREDILSDYEEHFRMRLLEGKTEEEIVSLLGDVRLIAKQYISSHSDDNLPEDFIEDIKFDTGIKYNTDTNSEFSNTPGSDYNKFKFSTQRKPDSTKGSIVKMLLITTGLIFFNLVFILGPYLGLAGLLIGLFAAAIGIAIGGIGIIAAVVLAPSFSNYINIGIDNAFAIFTSIGLICLGLLFFIGNTYIAKFFFKGTVKYLRWNMEIIKGKNFNGGF